ncbi:MULTISPECIES: thermonuclease family protein [unclassified Neisseria]|uniref:thermonuclease family protein n=1 Tax=unclassified Neisseria TaxID=2623750 RepID=UPI0026651F1F|nr:MULTISPECIES: thermonuclease family protein [unclassified Neisseria]MDO1510458.1 thermonuclease family protein [Neisseria sp. MVDL19-042950]MDO1516627.1 thermonuclease family protein [Neisseria sp. MVDL18-041461]MDO1563773.1 thermonuclease family protein [Neisseria sp. MVDL20-010259]
MKTSSLYAFAALLLASAAGVQAENFQQWLRKSTEAAQQFHSLWVQDHAAQNYSGRVVAVSDGDTVRVVDGGGNKHKIRLAYIDAPELQQAHGTASRDALRALVEGRNVEVTVFETDQYKREVAQVRLNGQDLNLAQLQQGHAWHYVSIAKRKQDTFDYAAYAYAEARARQESTGLWQNRNPQAPWDFRKAQRQTQKPQQSRSLWRLW